MKASFIQNPFKISTSKLFDILIFFIMKQIKISNNLLFNIYFSKVNDQTTSADQKLFILNYLTSKMNNY